jgi:hypothetical protein
MNRDVKAAINIAIHLADGRPTAELIEKAINLSGGKIVAAEGAADEQTNDSGVPKISRAEANARAQQWPKLCQRCNKVIADAAAADECTAVGCEM